MLKQLTYSEEASLVVSSIVQLYCNAKAMCKSCPESFEYFRKRSWRSGLLFTRLGSFLHHHGAALTKHWGIDNLGLSRFTRAEALQGASQAVNPSSRTLLSIQSGRKYIVTAEPRTQSIPETALLQS
jgi:hypothetical protein